MKNPWKTYEIMRTDDQLPLTLSGHEVRVDDNGTLTLLMEVETSKFEGLMPIAWFSPLEWRSVHRVDKHGLAIQATNPPSDEKS